MGANTKKKVFLAMAKKAYFEYWRFQNNPAYVEFYQAYQSKRNRLHNVHRGPHETWEEWTNRVSEDLIKSIPEKDYFSLENWYIEEKKKFGLGELLVDPFKKINWQDLENPKNIDRQIWDTIVDQRKERGSYPIKLIFPSNVFYPAFSHLKPTDLIPVIDISFDKKEILAAISSVVDQYKWRWGKATNFNYLKRPGRDTSKLHLYAQIWDLRKGFPKKGFREIARELRQPIQTVISQYKKAYELIYGKSYESTDQKSIRRSLIRKTTCKDCPDYPCKIPCPDVQIQLEELDVKQTHRLDRVFLDRDGEKKSTYELALDREAYRRWQEEKS